MDWQPIETAPRVPGKKILGAYWYKKEGKWTMSRDPFISFWSPTLNKFYCDPTHFIEMPGPPAKEVE